jgi:hypothetical protein
MIVASESAKRIEGHVTRIETTTNDIATKVTKVAEDQVKFEESRKASDSTQMVSLSGIKSSIDSCASEVEEQYNMLLQFRDRLETYVLPVPFVEISPTTRQFRGLSAEEQRTIFNLLQDTVL